MLPRWLTRSLIALPFVVIAYVVVSMPIVLRRAKPSLHLTGDEQMTLYSIDPDSKGPSAEQPRGEVLRGYAVFGKVEISDVARRKEIADGVNRAVANRAQTEYKCFSPRHAIRAARGEDVRDFLLCFECFNMTVYSRSGFAVGTNISDEPKTLLNKLLKDVGIKVAPEPNGRK